MLHEYDLSGRRALVTGAGRGIGKAIALTLAEAGADCALVARTEEQLAGTAAEIEALGRRATVATADVRSRADVDAAVAHALAELGHVDVVVNSAGTGVLKPLVWVEGMQFPGWEVADAWDEPMTRADWDHVIDSNMTSVLHMAQSVGPHLLARRGGRMINVISSFYDAAAPYHAAYCVSKAALQMLTRCLATEWAPFGVTVNGIAPGNTRTELNAASLALAEAEGGLDVPLGRAAEPREIGLLAAYLASDASAYMTGETVVIDGGELARGAAR